MNVLVIGCGKVGSRLAMWLYEHGHNVSIVDQDEGMFAQLGDDFDGVTVTGMPMDMETLRNAGVECCEAVAVTTPDDNLNITVSQIVKTFFGVSNVVTRISDPARELAFHNFGLRSVCSTNMVVSAISAALTQPMEEKQVTFQTSTLGVGARRVDEMYVGRNLDSLPKRTGEVVIGVLHTDGRISMADGKRHIELHRDDQIVFTHLADN